MKATVEADQGSDKDRFVWKLASGGDAEADLRGSWRGVEVVRGDCES